MAERMREIRMAPETEVERREAQAVATEAHLGLRPDESRKRIETHRRVVQAAASRVRRLLARSDELTEGTRCAVDDAFEGLRAILTAPFPSQPGSSRPPEAAQLAEHVRRFDEQIDRAAEEGGDALMEDLGILARDFVATTDALAAELAAARYWPAADCTSDLELPAQNRPIWSSGKKTPAGRPGRRRVG
jgi:hypothetical protein